MDSNNNSNNRVVSLQQAIDASSTSFASDTAIAVANASRATYEDDNFSVNTIGGDTLPAGGGSRSVHGDVASIATPSQAFSEGLGLVDNDDDSFTTIKTERSMNTYKVELSFSELNNVKMEIANTSFVKESSRANVNLNIPSLGLRRPPLSSSRDIHSSALSALSEEIGGQATVDSEGAVGVHAHEDDGFSIATERSFTGAMINLVIKDRNEQGSTAAHKSAILGNISLDDSTKDEVRHEKGDDDVSVVTAG